VERDFAWKYTVVMIIRATQKKMMSKPVTSTDEGRNVRSSFVSAGHPSVEWHHSADENQVSGVGVLLEARRIATEFRPRPRRAARSSCATP
jgi:hypothetical protein